MVVYFIGTYMTAITGTPDWFQPGWWIIGYIIFVGLNVRGVALSFKVTVIVTLIAIAILVFFLLSALFSGQFDFGKWAMNIGVGPDGAAVALPDGHGPFLPFGVYGVLAALPFAVWLFLAIEQLPLASEELVDPKRDMPKGIMLGMFTLIALGFLVLIINPAIPQGSFAYGTSGQPILDGFAVIYGSGWAKILSLFAVAGLVASFHAIIFAYGRQIYSLSRAGYFPHFLSVTHGEHKTPNIALVTGGVVGLAVMLVVWFAMGGQAAGTFIGSVLLNMAVFGAMFSYLLQALTFLPAQAPLPEHRTPLSEPVRRHRRLADGDHRLGDDILPADRSALSPGRHRRRHLVHPGDRLLRRLRPKDARLLARGGVRREASRETWNEVTKWTRPERALVRGKKGGTRTDFLKLMPRSPWELQSASCWLEERTSRIVES